MAEWEQYDLDEDDAFQDSSLNKSALLVIIDTCSDMFRPWKNSEKKPFQLALEVCLSLWKSKVFSHAKDQVAILLSGTEKSKNSSQFANLYVLQEMSKVKWTMIKELQNLVSPTGLEDFEDKIGSSSDYDLNYTFWMAKFMFDEAKASKFMKQIMFFTCEDNPNSSSPRLQQDAISKFKDLGDVHFNIVTFRDDFSHEKFYHQIFENEENIYFPKDFDSLLKVTRIKQKQKRPMTRISLEIFPGHNIAVGVYKLISKAVHPRPVTINTATNEEVTKSTSAYNAETSKQILNSEIVKAHNIQGETVLFTEEELKKVKYLHDTGLKIIGFIDAEIFDPFLWFKSECLFLYPNDENAIGSKDLFTSLWKRCQDLNKMILIQMGLTRGRTPKLCLLIPSTDDEVSGIKFPQGFHVFVLPFSDEMRTYPNFESYAAASPELVEKMEKIVKKLSASKFDIKNLEDPALQYKYRLLEELALEEPLSTTFLDSIDIDDDTVRERLGSLPAEMMTEIGDIPALPSTKAAAPSRVINMNMEVKNKRVDKLTIPEIKEFLTSKGLKPTGKKADLVNQVYKFYE